MKIFELKFGTTAYIRNSTDFSDLKVANKLGSLKILLFNIETNTLVKSGVC